MNETSRKSMKVIGWILFLFSIGLFCLQMGYLFVSARYEVEYVDDRLFYIINMLCVISIFLVILLLLRLSKGFKIIGTSIVVVFLLVQVVLLFDSNKEIRNITSISPNWKHVLSIKENVASGETIYYRNDYVFLARPKERLPYEAKGEFKIDWLANDVAAVTYRTANNTLQQFIATYGDRGSGRSYYYVGAEIHGIWQGENMELISNTEGISVTENGKTELFQWDDIHQFGTLAVVLKKNSEAIWTIALNENFEVHSDPSKPKVGNISLYKATMEENKPITLHYKGPSY